MSKHNTEGPPCAHMEQLLQAAADNSITGIRRWYVLAHAARCFRCGNFLQRMRLTVNALHEAGKPMDAERIARMKAAMHRDQD